MQSTIGPTGHCTDIYGQSAKFAPQSRTSVHSGCGGVIQEWLHPMHTSITPVHRTRMMGRDRGTPIDWGLSVRQAIRLQVVPPKSWHSVVPSGRHVHRGADIGCRPRRVRRN
jgi:hypothetical protein